MSDVARVLRGCAQPGILQTLSNENIADLLTGAAGYIETLENLAEDGRTLQLFVDAQRAMMEAQQAREQGKLQ